MSALTDVIPNRRRQNRYRRRVDVRFGTRRYEHWGLVHNVSASGIGMFTSVVYPPGKHLQVALLEGDDEPIEVMAQVRWTRLLDSAHGDLQYEMGLALTQPPPQFRAFFETVQHQGDPRRHADRHTVMLPVEFVEPSDIAPGITRNIAEGGAYVSSDQELEVGMLAVVRIALPGLDEPVRALGRVVHVNDPSETTDPGGVGLRFLRFYAGSEQRLNEYLDNARDALGIRQVDVTSAGEFEDAHLVEPDDEV